MKYNYHNIFELNISEGIYKRIHIIEELETHVNIIHSCLTIIKKKNKVFRNKHIYIYRRLPEVILY